MPSDAVLLPRFVLGLDCATTGCSAAVWGAGEIRSWQHFPPGQAQSGALMPLLAAVLAEAGLIPLELDRIAVTIGPGSFTGVRVGLAAARGLALALGCPVVGLTTTAVIALGVPEIQRQGQWLLATADSRRAEPFGQLFDPDLTPVTPPQALTAATLALLPPGPLLVAGDGAAGVTPLLAARPETRFLGGAGLPDARLVARLGAQRPALNGFDIHPLYIRPPDVTLPQPRPA